MSHAFFGVILVYMDVSLTALSSAYLNLACSDSFGAIYIFARSASFFSRRFCTRLVWVINLVHSREKWISCLLSTLFNLLLATNQVYSYPLWLIVFKRIIKRLNEPEGNLDAALMVTLYTKYEIGAKKLRERGKTCHPIITEIRREKMLRWHVETVITLKRFNDN